jgi:putative NADH-flavin reductase
VATAVADAEAVLSALGPGRNSAKDVMAVGMANIVAGMKQHEVRRLVVSTGAGVAAPQDRPTFMNKAISFLLKLISKDVLEDSLRGIQIVRDSGLDWTVVRGPMLVDSSRAGNYRVGFVGPDMGRTLSRANFAEFMLRQIEDDTYVQQMPVVSDLK